MSGNAKPYTSEDLDALTEKYGIAGGIAARIEGRIRATVEALERVTKERDEARAAAEKRAQSTPPPCEHYPFDSLRPPRCKCAGCVAARDGWVSPEAFDAALREMTAGCCVGPQCPACERIIADAKAKHGGGR